MTDPPVKPVQWVADAPGCLLPGRLRLIDQTALPHELRYVDLDGVDELADAIRRLVVRGAPAIGVAAAFGVVLGVQRGAFPSAASLAATAERAADTLAGARPTAVNLFWALARMRRVAQAQRAATVDQARQHLAREAAAIFAEDIAMGRAIGEHGAALLASGMGVLTHCNAGGLATAGFGTALAPVYVAHARGIALRVFAGETRPLLQGARLTAWELRQAGIDVTLLCDGAAGQLMRDGRVNLVLVGADRVAANGDTANKIGTYPLAALAAAHEIPFYVALPSSTVDLAIADGAAIPIEHRAAAEVVAGFGRPTAPAGVQVYNPAFDVTPHRLITGFITEQGIARPPYARALEQVVAAAAADRGEAGARRRGEVLPDVA